MSESEVALASTVFADAIDYGAVRIANRAWWPLQPRDVAMAPRGCIHFHPEGGLYQADFAAAPLHLQGLFLHELTHVWQHQRGICLPLARHPFCRYHYRLTPGWPLTRYGLEQQAEIVRHTFLLRRNVTVPGAPPLAQYETLLRFNRR